MKKKEKKMILILVGVVVVLFVVFLIVKNIDFGGNNNTPVANKENTIKEEFVKVLEDGTKLNTSAKLSETKKIGDLEIGNIQLTNNNGMSVILADVVNKGTTATSLMEVTLTLFDKNNNKLTELDGLIDSLAPGASTQLNMSVTSDYANAYNFTVVKK